MELSTIEQKLDILIQRYSAPDDTRAELYGALAKAQGAYKPLTKTGVGRFGAFANLRDVIVATRSALSENGLSFFQEIQQSAELDGRTFLETKLCHSSGACLISRARVVPCTTDRETGNAYEFQKRLHATCLLGIAPSDTDPELYDDDGLDQMDNQTLKELREPKKEAMPEQRIAVIDTAQYKMILAELNGYPEIASNVMSGFKIKSLADIPATEFYKTMDHIRSIKHTTDTYLKGKKRTVEYQDI